MKRKGILFKTLFTGIICAVIIGCSNKFWDPTQIGRFRPTPVVNVILDSLGVAEENSPIYDGAEDPRPSDVIAIEEDYRFNPGDIVRISIFELLQENQTFINDYIVTETGKISIPEVGQVQAGGLTEKQLEEEIFQILSPGILKDPSVTVILQTSQKRVFSIYGQGLLGNPGRYPIPRYNFRLADAVALAGGISEFNASYVYLTREVSGDEMRQSIIEKTGLTPDMVEDDGAGVELNTVEPLEGMTEEADPRDALIKIIQPSVETNTDVVIASSEMVTNTTLEQLIAPEGVEVKLTQTENDTNENIDLANEAVDTAQNDSSQNEIEWNFIDGRWVPQRKQGTPEINTDEPLVAQNVKEIVPEGYNSDELDMQELTDNNLRTRVIKIPYENLVGGDPRYNIIIKAGDTISVPADVIGEFAILGNVNAQGYINLTGRPMTLMQSIAAAGGLGPLAWPENVEVRRRIGKDKEEIVMVNLKKISEGTQPDFFIKKDDTINVGTDSTSMWRAVLRNSFRATYGFGFIYDRNYADMDVLSSRPFNVF